MWNIIQNYYIFAIVAWIVVAVAMRDHEHYKKYLIISAVVYAAVLLYVTLLGRTAKSEYQMELSFLWEYRLALQGKTGWWFQIFDNIMLFLPMGWIYGSLKKGTCWWKAAVFGACISFSIELAQLVFKLGLFEFDDILNNTIGMTIGYGVYRVIIGSRKR